MKYTVYDSFFKEKLEVFNDYEKAVAFIEKMTKEYNYENLNILEVDNRKKKLAQILN